MLQVPVELQELVDIYDQPFVIIDDSHRVVVVNQAFQRVFRADGTRAIGSPCHLLMAKHQGPHPCGPNGESCPYSETFTEKIPHTSTFTYQDGEGREHLVRTHAYPLRTQNGRTAVGLLMKREAMPDRPVEEGGTCQGPRMVGQSVVFRETLDRLLMAANSDAPVLLQGDTGTGKELAANFVHRHSARHRGPFQTIDCSVLTGELFESEVFGHQRGSFTGSVREKRGLFELAHGGTLFLDEIGEMPPPLQAKLLRVLESGEFRRLGGIRTRNADVRIICATNRQLLGSPLFRSDLYYRIACLAVRLPSLAERRADIPLVAAELLDRIGRSSDKHFSIDEAALKLLQGHDFPGNIRELRNILWSAAAHTPDGHIGVTQIAAALPLTPQVTGFNHASPHDGSGFPSGALSDGGLSLRQVWDPQNLSAVLKRNRGNRRAAARELGVSERTIYRKIRELGLN
jgi:transcriptional regulator with PAS, ATPase and Fis domain